MALCTVTVLSRALHFEYIQADALLVRGSVVFISFCWTHIVGAANHNNF
jgi:hypothetical protein